LTNWCENILEVEGDKESIAAFRAQCFSSDGLFHFELVLPIPSEVAGVHDNRYGKLGKDGELGAAALLKSESALPFSRVRPILERQAVKDAGVRSYEDLEHWLRKNNPSALELGRKAVFAHSKTGFCFADDWTTANWGTSNYMNSGLRMESDTRVEITFATAWSTADKLFHKLAQKFPDLNIQVEAEEQGNGFAYRFTSKNGVVTEEELPWSPEFVRSMGINVDDEGNEIFEDEADESVNKEIVSVAASVVSPTGTPEIPLHGHRPMQVLGKLLLLLILVSIVAAVGLHILV
jgi:Ferredoxin-like domain in Api92-like protein